ncbi:hypothetical protein ACHAWF_002772 [Thalassiosira exigua]
MGSEDGSPPAPRPELLPAPSALGGAGAAAAAAASLAILVALLVARSRDDPEAKERAARAKEAKKEERGPASSRKPPIHESYRVRRSDLPSLSGRGDVGRDRRRGRKSNRKDGAGGGGGGRRPADASAGTDDDDRAAPRSAWLPDLSLGRFRSRKSEAGPVVVAPPPAPQRNGKASKRDVTNCYDDAVVVGLDCEMVGGGRGGWKSLLARCSVVTLSRVPGEGATTKSKEDGGAGGEGGGGLDRDLVVLYDKYVVPKEKITDYRTEWSGITKETYTRSSDSAEAAVPTVSFHKCQDEITRMFSSIEGKRVVVVGHALENDFDALEIDVSFFPSAVRGGQIVASTRLRAFHIPRGLERTGPPRSRRFLAKTSRPIQHPENLTRDTAFYPPYMRRSRRKLFPRKLSALASEELDVEIQRKDGPSVGHSSVEDAAAALRLYWHKHAEWERWLGHPLRRNVATRSAPRRRPLRMYLDGCNLPVGMRGFDYKELAGRGCDRIPSKSFQLTSRKRDPDRPSSVSTFDWIPTFRAALSSQSEPRLESITVMFDGAKFCNDRDGRNGGRSKGPSDDCETSVFRLDSNEKIVVEVTKVGASADDVLYHRCARGSATPEESRRGSRQTGKIIPLERVVDVLSGDDDDAAIDSSRHYVAIRRKAGGTKTHRRLFDTLHLRRPNEGALCLSSLTPALRKDGTKTAKKLSRERGMEKVIECELRRRDELECVVVTDDVYLTDRLVREGVLVLSFRQMLAMF